MLGSKTAAFESRLKELFDTIDAEMEARWSTAYPRHPARPPAGTVPNPEDDGLFNVGAAFSAGYGSDHGRGYVVEVRIATLERVEPGQRERIERYVKRRVDELLPEVFPGRDLRVIGDGALLKIVGDLSG